jgi:hypothetical protein
MAYGKSETMGYYKGFLCFWKNVDHGLPELEDARTRLKVIPFLTEYDSACFRTPVPRVLTS